MNNVFITGLPRSGTTLIRWIFQYSGYPVTNELHINNQFAQQLTVIGQNIQKLLNKHNWKQAKGKIDIQERKLQVIRSIYFAMSDFQIRDAHKDHTIFLNKTPNLNFNTIERLFNRRARYIICLRHPFDNIKSMYNTNFGKDRQCKNKDYGDDIFDNCLVKTRQFYHKLDQIQQDRVFYIKTDKLYDYNIRMKEIKKMFLFAGANIAMDTNSPYSHGEFAANLEEFIDKWPPINSGNTKKYKDFSREQKEILVNDKFINEICQKYNYNTRGLE